MATGNTGRMVPENTVLLVVDMQTRLAPAILDINNVSRRNRALVGAASRLDVPVLFTEQYPKGLGHTDPELRTLAPEAPVYEKIHFGSAEEDAFVDLIAQSGRKDVVITGTESHVCVLQTALGLMRYGYSVYFCADAVGSRTTQDKEIALRRAEAAGMTLVTTEMVLFEWLHRAATDAFASLLPIIRELAGND